MARSVSIFSRSSRLTMSSASGAPAAVCKPRNPETARKIAHPTRPDATTAPLKSSNAAGWALRDNTTAAVAAAIESSRKKCQGWKPASPEGARRSVEVAELIVETRFEFLRGRRRRRGVRLAALPRARPAQRQAADDDDAHEADAVRHEPREPVEAAIERHGQHFLAAVL